MGLTTKSSIRITQRQTEKKRDQERKRERDHERDRERERERERESEKDNLHSDICFNSRGCPVSMCSFINEFHWQQTTDARHRSDTSATDECLQGSDSAVHPVPETTAHRNNTVSLTIAPDRCP